MAPGPETTVGDGGERAYRALRHRDFRLLWSAEIVSSTGTHVQRIAVAWQIFELTGDALHLGLLGLFRFVPILLFGIAGGVIADRGDRRRTMLFAQVALLGTSSAFAVMTATGAITLPAIYGLTVITAICTAVAAPTRHALVPAIVPRQSIAGAMAMNMMAHQLAAVSGPAIGGVIIASIGLTAAYVADAISFAAVIAALLAIRAPSALPRTAGGGLEAALEGLRFLRASPILLGVMVLDFLATFFGASTLLMPIFAEEVLNVGASGLGWLLAAPAAGAMAASLVLGTLRTPDRPGSGVLVAVAIYGGCILGFGLSREFWLSLALLAGSGAADAVSMMMRHTVRNLITPDALRGRVAAAHSTFAMGGPQLGEFEAGAVASMIGAGPAVAIGGIGTVATAAIIAKRFPALARYRTSSDPALATVHASPASD